jgi:hypothetical protein
MRGANSEGRRTAKGQVVESRRAAMRGASSGGWGRDDEVNVGCWGRAVGKRVGIDGIGGAAPGLDLLGNALSVGRCEDTELGAVTEVVGQMVEQGGYGLGNPNRGKDAGAQEGSG